MPILARSIFVTFMIFGKPFVTTAFLGISKIPTVNVEIHSFSLYLFKNFCLPVSQICAR